MTRPVALAASWWSEFAEIAVELGPVGSWSPSGPAWGVGQWGVDKLGSGYLTAAFRDVTPDVLTLDVDTGRNGIDDPGEVGVLNLSLYDPAGEHGIAGGKELIGNLIRARAKHVATQASRSIFYGKITDARADESLSTPTVTIKAIDMLGAVLSTDDTDALDAQTVRERLDELLDRAQFPETMRALDDDATRLLAVDKPGHRLDAARGAVSSSIGGTLFAVGDGSIRYVHGMTNIDPSEEPRWSIGTVAGAVCPTSLALVEASNRVVNFYDWANQVQSGPARAVESSADSMRHYGRQASVRTDLLNSDAGELADLVHSEIARTAWPGDAVESVAIELDDDASAELVLAQIGDLCTFDYSGADPWAAWQVIGRYAHHISPDSWAIDLGAYAPEIAATWGIARWGISAWAA